jgi:hypothetical protein
MTMRRLLGLALILGCFGTLGASAQVNGIPPSITSLAPGKPAPGIPASITSLGPLGYSVPSANVFVGSQFPNSRNRWGYVRNPRTVPPPNLQYQYGAYPYGTYGAYGYGPYSYGFPYGPYSYGYAYGMPYYLYNSGDDVLAPQAQYQSQAQGQQGAQSPAGMIQPPGPTIFDSHGAQDYMPPPETIYDQGPRSQTAPAPRPAAATSAPEPQVKTVLVFRDGHQLEITNYAIADGTLLNLSGNGPKRIPLSDLDVNATVNANDARGVQFSLPTT